MKNRDEQEQELTGVKKPSGWLADTAIGRRPPSQDRVAAPGSPVLQTRPGTLGYDM